MTEEVKQLIQDARKGDAISQASLATRYRKGDGVSKSTIKAIWLYERARFIDNASDDDPDFVVINYAAFCEDNIYLSHSPIVRPFLKGVGTFAGWLAPYLYYKEPDYLLDRMLDMVRRVTGTVFGFILEFLWEIFIVVVPALLIVYIILSIKK